MSKAAVKSQLHSLGREFESIGPMTGPGLFARMLGRRAPKITALPPGVRVYAIGDIHGRADLLARARAFVAGDAEVGPERRYVVYLGDYVDRGPDSKGVIDQLLVPQPGLVSLCLRGNHDQSVLTFLEDPRFFNVWKGFGGQETLLSYGVQPPRLEYDQNLVQTRDAFVRALPPEHIHFLEGLPYFARIGGYLFVHAGFRPGVPLAMQRREDMLWIRNEFLDIRCDFGGAVVYGHTPSPEPVNRSNRIGIDTGAYATGNLTLAMFEGGERRFYAVTDDEVRPWY